MTCRAVEMTAAYEEYPEGSSEELDEIFTDTGMILQSMIAYGFFLTSQSHMIKCFYVFYGIRVYCAQMRFFAGNSQNIGGVLWQKYVITIRK